VYCNAMQYVDMLADDEKQVDILKKNYVRVHVCMYVNIHSTIFIHVCITNLANRVPSFENFQ